MRKLAIIGLGKIGEVHLEKYRLLKPGYEKKHEQLNLFFSVRHENKLNPIYEKMIEKHGRRYAYGFPSCGEMLERVNPDYVDICSPDECHARHLEMAIDSGAKVIMCEKPFIHPKDAEKGIYLLKKARKNKVILAAELTMIELNNQLSKIEINNKKYGEIQKLTPSRIVWITDKNLEGKTESEIKPDIDLLAHAIPFVDINPRFARKILYNGGRLVIFSSDKEQKEIVVGYGPKKIREWFYGDYAFNYHASAEKVEVGCNALSEPIPITDPILVSLEAFLKEKPIADGKLGMENAEKVAKLHYLNSC
jgi:hypothetical protein